MFVAYSHVIHTLGLMDCSTLYGGMSELCRVCHFYYLCMFQCTVHVRVVCRSSVWLTAVHFFIAEKFDESDLHIDRLSFPIDIRSLVSIT